MLAVLALFPEECRMSDVDSGFVESAATTPFARRGVALAIAALLVPVVAGVGLCFVTSPTSAFAASGAAVLVSALLLAIDAKRLGRIDLLGRQRESAIVLFLGMLALWIVVYPLVYFRRRHFGGPHLGVPAIVVALFLPLAPVLHAVLMPRTLPTCTSRDVVQLLEQSVQSLPLPGPIVSIDSHREIGFDPVAQRRRGRCVVHTDGQDVTVEYVVQWIDRDSGQYSVQAVSTELPSATSREVVRLLEQVIRKTPLGAAATSIAGHREVKSDRDPDRRHGQCLGRIDGQDIVVDYVVEWIDRDSGQFAVRTVPGELPLCTNPVVVRLLEQVIRNAPIGPSVTSIDNHLDISFDREANRRRGQCVVHAGGEEIVVDYLVEWHDRTGRDQSGNSQA